MERTSNLKFDVSAIIEKAKKLPKPKVKSVSINLPFISVNVEASDTEKKIAREVLIRLRDKRVLVAGECCPDCTARSLISIQEIRKLLVDKQVELPNDDSALFIVFDLMLIGIRQFLTYTEYVEIERPSFFINRDDLFGALEDLRGHLLRCVEQIALLADTSSNLNGRMPFNSLWEETKYQLESSVRKELGAGGI